MRTGIYFLLDAERIVYIGATHRYPNRIKEHSNKRFTTHRFIECGADKLAIYEKRWIAVFKPILNKHGKEPYKERMSLHLSKRVMKKLRGIAGRQKTISILVENALETTYGI